MATPTVEGGADIGYMRAMPGHADLATTEVYTRAGVTKLKALHTASHPARLAGRRSGAVESKTDPETELFAALDAEADTPDEVT